MIIHQSLADFILFLYVHMSQADKSYDPSEMAVIKRKMPGLFPVGTDFEKKLYTTIRQYNAYDKSLLTQLFEETIRHFKKDPKLSIDEKLYTDLLEIVSADGNVDSDEAKAFEALKKIIAETGAS